MMVSGIGSKETQTMTQLADETILVTGSTDGVGREVASALGTAGAEVLVHGRDQVRGQQVVDGIQRRGGRAVFYRADLSSLDEVRGLAAAIRRDHSRLSVLINNAGIGSA